MITCLEDSDVKTKSGLSDILAMCCWNFSCFPKSTFSFQSQVKASSLVEALGSGCHICPALDKGCVMPSVELVFSQLNTRADGVRH